MTPSQIRPARVDETARLTQIAMRATRHDGYDDGAISRFMPALTVNLALIAAGLVFVAEDEQGIPRGHVALRPTGMGGLILLEGIFVDPACLLAERYRYAAFRNRSRAFETDGRECHPDLFEPTRDRFLCSPRRHQDRHDAVRILP